MRISSSRVLSALTPQTEATFTNNTVLDCLGGNSALIIRAGGVTISNITFINCSGSAVMVQNTVIGAAVQFIGCKWIGNTGSAVSITNVTRQTPGSNPPPSVSFSSCLFLNNSATTGQYTVGGAVRVSFTGSPGAPSYPYASVSFASCNFSSNKALVGGAVYAAGSDASINPPYYNVSFVGSTFSDNLADDGPAIYLGLNTKLTNMDRCLLQGNLNSNLITGKSESCGALCIDPDSNAQILTIQNSVFSRNGGSNCSKGGAISYEVTLNGATPQPLTLTNVTLDGNSCKQGGGLYVDSAPKVFLTSSLVASNQATDSGGGVYFQQCPSFSISQTTFINNSATIIGGGVNQADLGTFNISGSTFDSNSATYGGALSGGRDSDLLVDSSTFKLNVARSHAGGLLCVECSTVEITGSSFSGNQAGSAGAIGLAFVSDSSSIASSSFINNSALSNQGVRFYNADLRSGPGAGGAVAIVLSSPTTISGSSFQNNTATFGAGLFMSQECGPIVTSVCPSQASIAIDGSTTFTGNAAVGGNGGAIFTASPANLTITCSTSSAVFSGNASVTKLLSNVNDPTVLNASGCPSWTGNNAIGGSLGGPVLSTPAFFVRLASIGPDLTSYASNSPITAQLELRDLWQQKIGPQGNDANSMTISAKTTGNQTSFSGSVATAVNGTILFSQLKVLGSPANITLSFTVNLPTGSPSQSLISAPSISLTIRPCLYGEVRTADYTLCSVCGSGTYSANPDNTVCDICPPNAECAGSSIIPYAGYWHSHPFSPQIHPCQNSACDFSNRTQGLIALLDKFNPNLPNVSSQLDQISSASCDVGYTGNLCGDCQPGYGHDSSGICSKCRLSTGANAILFILSFALTVLIVVITIRTVFTKGVNADELKQIQKEQKEAMELELLKLKASKEGAVPAAEASEKIGWIMQPEEKLSMFTKLSTAEMRPPTRSNDRPPTRANDPSYTGWTQSKGRPPYSIVIKIIISYLQVITIIKNVGLELPGFFDGFLGSNRQASAASGSLVVLECSLQDPSQGGSLSKSLQKALVMVFVPFIFLALAPLVWLVLYKLKQLGNKAPSAQSKSKGDRTLEGAGSGKPFLEADEEADRSSTVPLVVKSKDDAKIRSYLSRRMIITFLIVIFVMYPDTTDAFLSLFSCNCLDNAINPYASYRLATGCYFSYDMTTKCYTGPHLLVMVLVGVPGGIFWALGIPIGFAVYLWYYRSKLDEKVFAGRHSIMYQDYKKSHYQWESVILLRKFFTVIAVVFLRAVSTSFLMLILLAIAIIFLSLQLIFQPYQLDRMNKLEDMSLMSTVFTFYIVSLFSSTDVVTYNGKYGLSILLVIENVSFIAYCVWMLSLEIYEIALETLDVDGDGQVTEYEIKAYIRISVGKFFSPIVTPIVSLIFANRKRLFLRKSEAARRQKLGPDTPGSPRGLVFSSNQVHPDLVRPFEASLRGEGDRQSTRQVDIEMDGTRRPVADEELGLDLAEGEEPDWPVMAVESVMSERSGFEDHERERDRDSAVLRLDSRG